MLDDRPKLIAFYLPQFHPIPENDEWWGKGFTEWTNVAKANKFYAKHYQPRIPADLGFYDLRVPETRKAQVALAKEARIDGFCYWHYWFNENQQLLERPFQEVLVSGEPDFPFCLAWANENWYSKSWDKSGTDKLLIEQKYDGIEQYTKHFYDVLPAFKDDRYIKIDGKPIFIIYKPLASSEISVFIDTWRKLVQKEDLPGIYFIGHCVNDRERIDEYFKLDFDAVNTCCIDDYLKKRSVVSKAISYIYRHSFKKPLIVPYRKVSKRFFDMKMDSNEKVCPSIITGWDHTPRSGKNGVVFCDETPELFRDHAQTVLKNAKSKFVFIKSWNEWAEGNYLEPDLKFGKQYIAALSEAVSSQQSAVSSQQSAVSSPLFS